MGRVTKLLVAVALVAGGGVAANRSAHAAAPPDDFVYVAMPDGVEIATRVQYPPDYVAGNQYPVLMTMEGYGGAGGKNDTTFDNDHLGYVLVSASLRGTGCSGGTLALFSDQSAIDGKTIIDSWLPSQPWFNGSAGIFGHSYAGLTGFLIAAQSPVHLRATAVSGLIDDFYRGILYPGGVPNPGFPVLWGGALRPESEHAANLDELQNDAHCRSNYLQHQGSDVFTAQALLDTYGNRFASDSSWAIQQGLMNHVAGLTAPIQLGQQYEDEQTGPRGGHVLWENIPSGLPKRFVVSTGRHNPNDPTRTKKDWLDCWILHGGSTGAVLTNGHACANVLDPAQRVLAFFESQGSVRNAPLIASDWPLPNTDWTREYLRSDATLGSDPGPDGSVTYLSTGTGRHLTGDVGGLGPGGLGDVTYTQGLPDTARFALPFSTPTALAGPLSLTLWATTTTPDVDFWVEVLDHDTVTGAQTFVQRGMLRASLRATDVSRSAKVASGPHAGEMYRPYHTYLAPDPIIPGQPYQFDVEVFPLGHVFRAGHELVLQLHAPPANDPISTYAYEPSLPSVVSILQDAAHRTSILLPMLAALPPISATAPGCGAVIGEVCITKPA